jgi:cell division protein FtsI (penicillin-binding protein 3)
MLHPSSLLPRIPQADALANPGSSSGLSAEGQAVRTARLRLRVVRFMTLAAFLALGGKIISFTFLHHEQASSTVNRSATPPVYHPKRADIVDRNGTLLATNLLTLSLYANPQKLTDPNFAAAKILQVLPDLDPVTLRARLNTGRQFVWLRRNLTPTQAEAVNALGIPGIDFITEERRVYPNGSLAAHVLGFTNVDGMGLAGVEKGVGSRLRQRSEALKLSIDLRLQHILKTELTKNITNFTAIGGAAMIMDARTAEILAMVSLPDFDPNKAGQASDDARFNRLTLGVYEMGSTMKIFTTAMALQSGRFALDTLVDARAPIKVGRFKIDDYHAKYRWMTVAEAFKYSSNIASVQLALDAGRQTHQAFLQRLGFLSPLRLEIPEMGHPLVPHPWNDVNTMTIAFGHGLSINAVQLVTAAAAMVNGGVLRQPTLILGGNRDVPAEQVISPEVSQEIRKLMRLTIVSGTGSKAEVPGYFVGGKTGTSEKISATGYNKKALLSSFLATFPAYDPRYMIFVMIDEPKGNRESYGYATGGWVAAPVVQRVVANMAPLLAMQPAPRYDPAILAALMVPGEAPVAGGNNLAEDH